MAPATAGALPAEVMIDSSKIEAHRSAGADKENALPGNRDQVGRARHPARRARQRRRATAPFLLTGGQVAGCCVADVLLAAGAAGRACAPKLMCSPIRTITTRSIDLLL